MKTNSKIVSVFICLMAALGLPSCTVRYIGPNGQVVGTQGFGPMQSFGRQGGPMGPGGRELAQSGGQRSLTPYYPGQQPAGRVVTGQKQVQTGTKTTKKLIGSFTVQLWNSEDMALKQEARTAVESYFRQHDHTYPSDEYVSEQIGHKCRLLDKQ